METVVVAGIDVADGALTNRRHQIRWVDRSDVPGTPLERIGDSEERPAEHFGQLSP